MVKVTRTDLKTSGFREELAEFTQSSSLVVRWLNHHKFKKLVSRGTEIRLAWLECSDLALLPAIEDALIDWFNPELNQRKRRVRIHRPSLKENSVRPKRPKKAAPDVHGAKKKQFQFMLTEEGSNEIDFVADELGITRSEVLERAIRNGGLQAAKTYEMPSPGNLGEKSTDEPVPPLGVPGGA